jgi:hypothetical protein
VGAPDVQRLEEEAGAEGLGEGTGDMALQGRIGIDEVHDRPRGERVGQLAHLVDVEAHHRAAGVRRDPEEGPLPVG